jgi:type IV pilus assembly protein PilW
MRIASRPDARGFSLLELMVAMLVTMIVSGAIYGLMAGGQNAFRREPELADRQQNIRSAMDMIMRDIANAGSGLPPFIQTFTRGLNACTSCPNGGAPMGLDSRVTDELEIVTNDGSRDNEPLCGDPGNGSSGLIRFVRGTSTVGVNQPVVIIFDDGTWTIRNGVGTTTNNTAAQFCQQNQVHFQVDMRQGGDTSGLNVSGGICEPSATGLGNAGGPTDCNGGACGQSTIACPNLGGGPPCCVATQVSFAEVVRYRIRNDAGGVPQLQRSSTATPGIWQTVATGIEDLQVQYTQADGTITTEAPGAPQVIANNYGTIITQVQVALASRSEAQNIQGATTNVSATVARMRGRLVSTGSPRSSLIVVSQQTPNPTWQ